MTDEAPRPLRADAARNRTRVLEAARAVFAAHGVDAQMEDVARAAGVGVGTIYRHYPTKEALLRHLLCERMRRLGEEARAARAEEPTAWDAFRRFLNAVAELQAGDRSLVQLVAGRVAADDELRAAQSELLGEMTALIEAAQAEGTLRPEIAAGDVPLLLSGLGRSIWIAGELAPALTERYLAVILDGLRAPAARPLPGRPLAREEMDRILFAEDVKRQAPRRVRRRQ